jgi:hypothetical protein
MWHPYGDPTRNWSALGRDCAANTCRDIEWDDRPLEWLCCFGVVQRASSFAVDLLALNRPSDQSERRLQIAMSFGNALPAYVIEGRYRNNFAQLSPNGRARGTGTPEMCKVRDTGPPNATDTYTIFRSQQHFEALTLTVTYSIMLGGRILHHDEEHVLRLVDHDVNAAGTLSFQLAKRARWRQHRIAGLGADAEGRNQSRNLRRIE